MDERRTAEGVEHLQAAARELLGAARAFLDVVEDVVDDPDRLSGAAATVSDLVRGLTGRGTQPWERAAWSPGEDDDRDTTVSAWWDEPYEDEVDDASAVDGSADAQPATEEPAPADQPEGTEDAADPEDVPVQDAPAKKAPAKSAAKGSTAKRSPAKKKAPARKASAERPTSRVRRISVD